MAELRGNSDVAALTAGLTQALGKDLVSLMLYGSAARGTAVPGYSDLNVLLVVSQASPEVLRRAGGPLQAWGRAGHPAPLIQTEAEWRESADVFPLEIEDIREAHQLLAGRDVISGLATKPEDLREELEREARGKLIRLRAAWAAAMGNGRQLGDLLTRALGTFLVLLRAVLRLKGRPVPADPAELVRAAAGLIGFDAAAFDWALAARRAGKAGDPGESVAAAYLAAVEQLVRYINDQ